MRIGLILNERKGASSQTPFGMTEWAFGVESSGFDPRSIAATAIPDY
jgi:hypothetical protein